MIEYWIGLIMFFILNVICLAAYNSQTKAFVKTLTERDIASREERQQLMDRIQSASLPEYKAMSQEPRQPKTKPNKMEGLTPV